MADLTVNTSYIGRSFPENDEVRSYIPDAAVDVGQVFYVKTNGKVELASAAAAGTAKFAGLAMQKSGGQQAVEGLRRGEAAGIDVSAMNYGAPVYLSDTPGVLSDTAGTVSVVVGYVMPLSDSALTKVVYFIGPVLA